MGQETQRTLLDRKVELDTDIPIDVLRMHPDTFIDLMTVADFKQALTEYKLEGK